MASPGKSKGLPSRVLQSQIPDADKHALIEDYDRVLGLSLLEVAKPEELPDDVSKLVAERQAARDAKDWAASDRLRDAIQQLERALGIATAVGVERDQSVR